jgi:hypothetical protein
MAVKTGNKIRYKGVYRLYRNGVLVSETPYDLTDAFGSTPAITVEELQLMTAQDIEARAAAMIGAISGRCTNLEIINDPVLFGGCVDLVRKVIGGSPTGSDDRYPLDWGANKAIWVFYSVDGDAIVTDVDSLEIPSGQSKNFEVTAYPENSEWFVDWANLSNMITVTVNGNVVTVENIYASPAEDCELYIRWGTPDNRGSVGKTISITLLNT